MIAPEQPASSIPSQGCLDCWEKGPVQVNLAEVTVRPACDADEAFRFQLFRQSRPLEAFLSHLDPALVAGLMRNQFMAQTAGHQASFPAAQGQIIELHGEPAGVVVVDRRDRLIRVVNLAVMPAYRRRGIASAVLQSILAEGQVLGSPVHLTVAYDNVAAQRLYAGLGFVALDTAATDIVMVWQPETRPAS